MPTKKPIRAADLFCGAGGTSKGLALACEELGIQVDLTAINHWDVAVATHKENHPWAEHLLSKIEDVDPTVVVPGGVLDLLVASPECTHFSVARGGKPKEDQKRASPWVILPWLSRLFVRTLLIENVPEFQSWGPLDARGHPVPSFKGQTYRAFLSAIRAHGYTVNAGVLNAADYGDVTSRRRLFIIARRGRTPVRFPKPTHSKGGKAKGTKPWRAAREIIDWSLEGQSIFNRERPLADATVRRIIAGLEKFGGPELKPFLVVLRGTGRDQVMRSAKSVDEPVPTTAAGGGHVGVAQSFVVPQFSAGAPKSVEEPLGVVTSTSRGMGLARPFLVNAGSRGPDLRSIDEPVPTVLPKSGIALAKPFLVQTAYSTANGKCVKDVDEPTWAITGRPEQGLVSPAFTMAPGSQGRAQPVDGPLPTIVGAASVSLVEAALIDCYGPTNPEDPSRTRSVGDVIPTILGGGNRVGLATAERVASHLQTHFGERKGQAPRVHSVDAPVPAATSRAPQLVEGFLTNYHGNSTASSLDAPMPTIDTRDRVALVQPVIGETALDIRFRMLQPHELAAAMGFGATYKFTGNRADAVRQIGNAVAVNMAKALCKTLLSGAEHSVEEVA